MYTSEQVLQRANEMCLKFSAVNEHDFVPWGHQEALSLLMQKRLKFPDSAEVSFGSNVSIHKGTKIDLVKPSILSSSMVNLFGGKLSTYDLLFDDGIAFTDRFFYDCSLLKIKTFKDVYLMHLFPGSYLNKYDQSFPTAFPHIYDILKPIHDVGDTIQTISSYTNLMQEHHTYGETIDRMKSTVTEEWKSNFDYDTNYELIDISYSDSLHPKSENTSGHNYFSIIASNGTLSFWLGGDTKFCLFYDNL